MNNIVEHVRGLDQIEQRTPAWYAAREHMLTASDAAAAIGENPYESRRKLLQKKVGPVKPFTGNFATIHGNKYEDEARFLFGKLYNLETWEVGLFRHLEYKWLGGSPDGIASDGSLLEIKCPIKREIKHEIPSYYYPQVQLCMEILKIPQCYFIQYKPATIYNDPILDVVVIKRSTEWFAKHFDTFKKFMEDVSYHREHPEIPVIPPRAPRVIKPKPVEEIICYFKHDEDDAYERSDMQGIKEAPEPQ